MPVFIGPWRTHSWAMSLLASARSSLVSALCHTQRTMAAVTALRARSYCCCRWSRSCCVDATPAADGELMSCWGT